MINDLLILASNKTAIRFIQTINLIKPHKISDMATGTDSNHHQKQRNADIARQIIHMLESIRYGSVEIVVHDSKIVQIERKEKLRPDAL